VESLRITGAQFLSVSVAAWPEATVKSLRFVAMARTTNLQSMTTSELYLASYWTQATGARRLIPRCTGY